MQVVIMGKKVFLSSYFQFNYLYYEIIYNLVIYEICKIMINYFEIEDVQYFYCFGKEKIYLL